VEIMNKKEIVLQIFTGGYLKKEASYEEIENKLNAILEKVDVCKLIIGWTADQELYRKVIRMLHSHQIEVFFWMPIFSETGFSKTTSLLKDFQGMNVENYQLKEGENFEFYCPNVKTNRDNVKKIYEEHFSNLGFDGVFLDKIRYASFSNRLTGVFSCFCPECIKRYHDKRVDINRLRREMESLIHGKQGYDMNPFQCTSYCDGEYTFKDSVWEHFFQVKADFIYDALKDITDYFRAQGLKIGMDTFAPFMAYFVGQDLNRISELADFIKPMMYRMTQAPAGLPFEYNSFLVETTKEPIEDVRQAFNRILKIEADDTNLFDIDFVKRELEFMNHLKKPIYCGVEVNKIEEAASADPEYIKETIEALSQIDVKGYVLSWNILSAPKENLEAVYRCL